MRHTTVAATPAESVGGRDLVTWILGVQLAREPANGEQAVAPLLR